MPGHLPRIVRGTSSKPDWPEEHSLDPQDSHPLGSNRLAAFTLKVNLGGEPLELSGDFWVGQASSTRASCRLSGSSQPRVPLEIC